MTLAQEGYEIMKEMPSRQLMPIIQLLRVMKENNEGNDKEKRMKVLAEMNEIRLSRACFRLTFRGEVL